jgi:hypothetical protein
MKYQIYFPIEKCMEKVHGTANRVHGARTRVHTLFIKQEPSVGGSTARISSVEGI